jgi:hypothetical protein
MAVLFAPPRRSVVAFDEWVAARHRSEFVRLAEDPETRGRIVADVVGCRAKYAGVSAGSSSRVAIDELEGRDGSLAMIARGEVLVIAPSAEIVRLLDGAGFAFVGSAGPVLRFQNRHVAATTVGATCHELLWRGVKASPNYIVYAGGRVKGRLGLLEPLPTNIRPAEPRARERLQDAVQVAVLDTASNGVDSASGHGTFVADLVRQLAPGCQLDMQGVLAGDGLGTDFSVAQALHRLAADVAAVSVVNLSLYCTPVDGLVPVAMANALDVLAERHPETVVVAAAGNDGSSRPSWPAAHPFVVAVGAADQTDPAVFSNRGSWVDFSARADGVVSQGAAWSGTSFAAAQVSGAVAAIIAKGLSRAEALGELTTSGTMSEDCGVILDYSLA